MGLPHKRTIPKPRVQTSTRLGSMAHDAGLHGDAVVSTAAPAPKPGTDEFGGWFDEVTVDCGLLL